MNLRHILCPTDFSETSAHAVEQAAALADCYHAGITALHVVGPIEPGFDGISLDHLQREVTAFFEGAAKKGIELDVRVEVGQPVRHILETASSLPADMIVIGTHGAGGFEHLVLGSVAEKVLRKATCPVLTVPPCVRTRARLPFARLLCAVDFSDASQCAVRAAVSLARESGARLTLVHVLEWPWEEPPSPALESMPAEQGFALAEFRRYTEESAAKRLESLVPDSASGSDVTTRLRSGKPHVEILKVAAEEGSDCIVIGVRGRNPLDLAVFGSTANHVVRGAACPVLTLR